MNKDTKIKHIILASIPRLSDEEPDLLERDDSKEGNFSVTSVEGWVPWSDEDIEDIRKIITENLDPKEMFIFEAYLDGLTYNDISVTEKYWRYHFSKGLEIIKRELQI